MKRDQGVKVRLTRKLSDVIDDVNLSTYRVGDVIELPPRDAKLLLAEEWAAPAEHGPIASDRPSRRRAR